MSKLLRSLQTQSQGTIAVVLIALSPHVHWREMSCAQLARAEALPDFDIDTVAIRDAEQALGAAHHGADALVHGIGKLDAGNDRRVRARNAPDTLGALGIEEPLAKASVPGRSWAGHRSVGDSETRRYGRDDRLCRSLERGRSNG